MYLFSQCILGRRYYFSEHFPTKLVSFFVRSNYDLPKQKKIDLILIFAIFVCSIQVVPSNKNQKKKKPSTGDHFIYRKGRNTLAQSAAVSVSMAVRTPPTVFRSSEPAHTQPIYIHIYSIHTIMRERTHVHDIQPSSRRRDIETVELATSATTQST